jgi:hypothetical protein
MEKDYNENGLGVEVRIIASRIQKYPRAGKQRGYEGTKIR